MLVHQLNHESSLRAENQRVIQQQAAIIQRGTQELHHVLEARKKDNEEFKVAWNVAQRKHKEEMQKLLIWAEPSISHRDRMIGSLQSSLNAKNSTVRKLKRTLKHSRRYEAYEPRCSLAINNFLFFWREHYVCRHFTNGDCHSSDENCPRLHCCGGKKMLLRDLKSIRLRGCAPFIDHLLDEATMKNWASTSLIEDIRDHMYRVA